MLSLFSQVISCYAGISKNPQRVRKYFADTFGNFGTTSEPARFFCQCNLGTRESRFSSWSYVRPHATMPPSPRERSHGYTRTQNEENCNLRSDALPIHTTYAVA